MIAILSAKTPAQYSEQRHAAHMVGLPFEPAGSLKAEVTFQNPVQVLSIIERAGGRIVTTLASREMTRKEML